MRATLRSLRERQGLRADDVARGVGCSRSAVSMWEAGRATPSGRSLLRYADVLGVPPARVLDLCAAAMADRAAAVEGGGPGAQAVDGRAAGG